MIITAKYSLWIKLFKNNFQTQLLVKLSAKVLISNLKIRDGRKLLI